MTLLFTIAQIARALGCTKQNIHQRLHAVPADGERLISGNRTNAWRIESLPAGILCQLSEKARAKQYGTIADLLKQPFNRYQPCDANGTPIALAGIAPAVIEHARKLRNALLPVLPLRNDATVTSTELAKLGLESYEAAFGFSISERRWRDLFQRTIDRDNGAQEWNRLEIYLPQKPRRVDPNLPVSIARERGLTILEDALTSIETRSELSVEQKDYLWTKTCDELELQIGAGAREKKTKRAILKALLTSGLFGTDKEAIRRNLNRHWAAYCATGGRIRDKRRDRNCRASWPKDDLNKLTARSLDCGGRERQAFRELRDGGELSPETSQRTIANPSRKSYMPASLSRKITPLVKRMMPLHHGPREHQLRGPYNTRDQSCLFAGDSYQADDLTCPVYYWEHDPSSRSGFRIVRGQLLLMIDERSRLILGFALHSDRNYNARVIRALITRVHDGFGLPRRRFYFERGIWQSSKILTGSDELRFEHTELGLREFGIRFVHAKLPRAKVIERILGILQNSMERMPGYAGRNEINDRFERAQEQKQLCENGRDDPSKFFMEKVQWEAELARICERYNAERQEGALRGLSPIEAWNRFQATEPLVHLGLQARYLLAHHKFTMKVQRGGITLRPSLGGGTYCNEHTGNLVGEKVLVWIDPEDLSSIALTSVDRKTGPFIVPKLEPLPAIDASHEQFEHNAIQIAAHNGAIVTTYRLISPHLVRRNFRPINQIDESTITMGERLEHGAAEIKTQKKKLRADVRTIASRSRELGITIPIHGSSKSVDRVVAGADLMAESRRLKNAENPVE
jgi:hypothetical protein